jgi:hypothetical protein
MLKLLSGTSIVALALSLAVPASAQDKAANPLPRREVDQRILNVVVETIDLGADIYNKGNREGCYRLYQGTLQTVAAFLDHRPTLKEKVEKNLRKAKTLRTPAEQAFLLRESLDEIQKIVDTDLARAAKPSKSLWNRLGGEAAVKAVVHDFVVAAAQDPKVNFTRDGQFPLDEKGVARLEQLLVELVSAVSGGPLK